MAEPALGKPGPRVRIVGDGTVYKTKVFVGDQSLVNCVGIELTLDPDRGLAHGVLHLIDVEVDLDLFGPDMVVMVQPVDEQAHPEVRPKASELDGHEIVRELRRLKQNGIQP